MDSRPLLGRSSTALKASSATGKAKSCCAPLTAWMYPFGDGYGDEGMKAITVSRYIGDVQ